MNRGSAYFLHGANLVVCATGLVYAWMRYLVQPTDEWAVVNHPWQPHVQHLHVLAAPLLVFALGLIWSAHVIAKTQNGRKNRSAGIGLTALFFPMAASGYLLQVAVDPIWRTNWMWVHVVSSLLWIVVFFIHQLRAVMSKNQNGMAEAAQAQSVAPFRMTPPDRESAGLKRGPAENDVNTSHVAD